MSRLERGRTTATSATAGAGPVGGRDGVAQAVTDSERDHGDTRDAEGDRPCH